MASRYAKVKRALDLALVLCLAPFALLLVGLCCAAIKITTGGPVFYVQIRPGYHGKLFRVLKLRSMVSETEREGRLLRDDERLTPVGRVIRRLSLDELPQLLNIVKGEMSFIGPRPLLPAYLPRYSKEQMRRHDVLPGISGWAQVNGRNELSWEQKFVRDVWYVDHISFGLDCKIFVMTIVNVLKGRGINAGTVEAMPDFSNDTEDAAQ